MERREEEIRDSGDVDKMGDYGVCDLQKRMIDILFLH